MAYQLLTEYNFEQELYLYRHTPLSPALIVKAFGEPTSKGEEYKVSREYFFRDEDGYITGIWDYKMTSLYDEDLPDPEQFWKSTHPQYMSVVGASNKEKNEAFLQWVISQTSNLPFSSRTMLDE